MGQWFPALDAAVGGTADAVEDSAGWVLGGIGSTAGNALDGTGDVLADVSGDVGDAIGGLVGGAGQGVGQAAGSVTGGLFGGLGNWMLKIGALLVGAVVVMKVVA